VLIVRSLSNTSEAGRVRGRRIRRLKGLRKKPAVAKNPKHHGLSGFCFFVGGGPHLEACWEVLEQKPFFAV